MEQSKDEKLGTEKLGKLIVSMALPAVAAQLINVLYNIVDRIYIGHIAGHGDMALTGVGVTFPIITIISAFSAFAGMGGAPIASIHLGKKDYEGAEKILGNSTSLLLLFSVVLTAFFMIFKTPILYAFGASDNIISYAQEYITIYLVGTVFVQLAIGLNTFISGQGNAKVAMLSVLIGAIINIVLDPIFIFLFDMGVKGAALATILSQAVSAEKHYPYPKKIFETKQKDCRGNCGNRHFPIYYAEHRKPCDGCIEQWASEIWRRSVCWNDVHSDECDAADHCSDSGCFTGSAADHQL